MLESLRTVFAQGLSCRKSNLKQVRPTGKIMEATSIEIKGAKGPWAYRINGIFVASSEKSNGHVVYNMFREEGIRISLMYSSDDHWRILSFEEGTDEEGFAQTKMTNLERPYGKYCTWEVKYNMVGESGMVEAPDLQVIPLNKRDTIIRKKKVIEQMQKADKDAHDAPPAFLIRSKCHMFTEGVYIWTGKWQNRRKVYQYENGKIYLRYGPNRLWMLCREDAYLKNNSRGTLKSQNAGLASPGEAAGSWFHFNANKWTPTTGIEVEGLDKFALDAEVRQHCLHRFQLARKSLRGPRQLFVHVCGKRNAYKDIINGFYEAKPPPPDAQKVIEEYYATMPKVRHRPPSPFTEEEKRQLYNGRLAYFKDGGSRFRMWLRLGKYGTWIASPERVLMDFDEAGFLWSLHVGLLCPSEEDDAKWLVAKRGSISKEETVYVRTVDQLARDFIKKKSSPREIGTLLKCDRSGRARALVLAAMQRRLLQVKVTRQFPFALFCIRSASVRSVYTSVVLHGYVRKLIASYLGIDIVSRIGRDSSGHFGFVENKFES